MVLGNGAVVTDAAPGDHPWHNGVFFAWKYLNRFNVWDQQAYEGHVPGSYRSRGLELLPAADGVAWAEAYAWCGADGAPLLEETRTHAVRRDGADVVLDIGIATEARHGPVVAERQESWGGYGGLMVRTPRTVKPELRGGGDLRGWPEKEKPRCRWVDLAWNADGLASRTWHEHWVGVAVFDHPSNPGHPLPFHTYTESWCLGVHPAVLQDRALRLEPGNRLEQRYRLWFHAGRATAEALEERFRAWAA